MKGFATAVWPHPFLVFVWRSSAHLSAHLQRGPKEQSQITLRYAPACPIFALHEVLVRAFRQVARPQLLLSSLFCCCPMSINGLRQVNWDYMRRCSLVLTSTHLATCHTTRNTAWNTAPLMDIGHYVHCPPMKRNTDAYKYVRLQSGFVI